MQIFWDRGFHDASLPDLLAGMQLSKGSFYKAFGDKKSVFLRALEFYTDDGVRNVQEVLRSAPRRRRQSATRWCGMRICRLGKKGCAVVSVC
ncbi:TetR/AcrR family transcriptional regulator [Bradyrhizobium japonicum]|uniref:TetR/AcrR family transcriptional regulator n=1 Tax=Bradyrhizobium japonicum TaxID=375 RepID=UPI001F0AE269|nr:TetR/AcrR family transcriptional regulator [Bradyrhizobium japonicum]